MSGVLDAIVAAARRSAAERARVAPRAALERIVAARTPQGLLFRERLARPGVNVIAECKRRSPSRGILRADYDPEAIAAGYERAGAAAISVLTEPTCFDGSLEHIRRVRTRVGVPLLRKDFVVDDYQIVEAGAFGADAVLLIVSALDDAALRSLMATAEAIGLAALVEVHDVAELDRALDAGARVVGVNSRNLRTLAVDRGVLDDLGARIPAEVVGVAESGLKEPADVQRLRAAGYRAFLIGERFMVEADPGRALASLLAAAGEGAR